MNRRILSAVLSGMCALSLGAALAGAKAATITITTNTVIEATDTTYDGQDLVVTNCVLTVKGDHGFNSLQVTTAGTVTIAGGATLNITASLHVAGNSAVVCQGTNTVDKIADQWAGAGVRINAGNVTVEAGSRISADAQGYVGGDVASIGASGRGPGGAGADVGRGGGGGYGGTGGTAFGGGAYGSATEPADLGSGGGDNADDNPGGRGGNGGGAIRLVVTGTLSLEGAITANGEDGVGGEQGGGSGGSVWLTCGTLQGAGAFLAKGGSGQWGGYGAGGGAGGRLAVYYAAKTFTGAMSASGGGGPVEGGEGTVFAQATVVAYQPDLQVRREFDPQYAGVGVYNATGAGQTKRLEVTGGATAKHLLRLVNAGNRSEQFLLTGAAAGTGWTVKYTKADVVLQFDGSDDVVAFGNWSPGPRWTVEAWVKPSSIPGGRRTIVGDANACADWGVTMQDGQFGALIRPPGGCSTTLKSGVSVVADTWYHVAATCDGFTAQLYVDGVLMTSGAVDPDYGPSPWPRVGGETCCGGNNFPGLVKEVRLWHRALSAEEIQGRMNQPLVGSEQALIGYWRLDDGSGTTAHDYSAGGHNGTLNNGPVWVVAMPDLTTDFTGTGWTSLVLPPGGAADLIVEVTPDATVADGAALELSVTATSVQNNAKADTVKLVTYATQPASTPTSALFTSSVDFEKGLMVGVEDVSVPDQLQLAAGAASGVWTGIFDSRLLNTAWDKVVWHGVDPAGTNIVVRACSANDQQQWTPWAQAVNGARLTATPPGRYLQVEVTLYQTAGEASPVLYDVAASALAPAAVDLGMALVATPTPGVSEHNLAYTITVSNPSDAWASGVVVTNVLPAGVALISVNVPGGSFSVAEGVLTLSWRGLVWKGSVTATINVVPPAPGTLTDSADLTFNETDPNPANNQAQLVTAVGAAPCASPLAGLVGLWKAEGNARDLVGGNNGILRNGATFTARGVGQAFLLSGSANVEVPNAPALNPNRQLTVAGWLRTDGFVRRWQTVFWKGNEPDCTGGCENRQYALFLNSDGQFEFDATSVAGVGSGQISMTTPSLISVGQWYHFAAVINTELNYKRLYINGQLVGEQAFDLSGIRSTGGPLLFGRVPSWDGFFNGALDELCVYNVALSQEQIGALVEARSSGICPDTLLISQPAELSGGIVGKDYTQRLTAALGTAPYSFTVKAGALPDGLTLSGAGAISGVPTQAGAYNFTAKVTDAAGKTADKAYTLIVDACTPWLDGLVGWWRGEGNGDDFAGANHGTLGRGVSFVPGKVGRAFRFVEWSESYVRLPNSPAFQPANNQLTIEAWVKPDFTVTGNRIDTVMMKRDGCGTFSYWLGIDKGARASIGSVWFGTSSTPEIISTDKVPNDGQFHHVAATFDGNKTAENVHLYLDGVEIAAADAPGPIPVTSSAPWFGRHADCGAYSSALMDEIAFYGRELSAAEIKATYDAGIAGKCVPPSDADLLAKNADEDDAAFALDNVYQPVPEGEQVKTKWVTPFTTTSHVVKLQNDAAAERSFVLRTVESSELGWSIVYHAGTNDVSEALRSAQGLAVANLPPGGSYMMTVDMVPDATMLGFASKAASVEVFYEPTAATPRDSVKLVAVNTPNYQPDLLVRREIDVNAVGKHVYNRDGAGQTKATETDAAVPAIYYVQLVNDGNLTNEFLLRGGECTEGWLVRYFDAPAGGRDITTEIADAGWIVKLAIGASREFRVEVVPKSRLAGGATRELFVTATSLINAEQADTVRMTTTVSADVGFPLRGVYTSTADFEEGTLAGIDNQTVPGQLQLARESVTLPFIWVPNSNEGTVSKVDTRTGKELGRYRVAPLSYAQPSRTTIDLEGNCWVANRQIGTAVKVGLLENGQFIDRNEDGVIQTSRDLNGDGDITGNELLPWGQDECVLFEVILIPGQEGTFAPGAYTGSYANDYWNPGPRGVAVDANDNVWVGTYNSKKFYYVDGASGNILRTLDLTPVDHTSYGAVMDAQGILWSSPGATKPILRLDPRDDSMSLVDVGHFVYGLGLDRNNHLFASGWQASKLSRVNVLTGTKDWTKDGFDQSRGVAATDDGDVWVANTGPGTVARWSNDGVVKTTIGGFNQPTGVSVDAAGKVWVVDNGDGYIHRIDPRINGVDLSKNLIGTTHYGYSDMTGVLARNVTTRIGEWTVIHNSRNPDTAWDHVAWNSLEPPGTTIKVKVRSSSDRVNWSAWETAVSGEPLKATPRGKYLQVQVIMQIFSGDVSPALYDLTVVPRFDARPVHPADNQPADNVLAVGEVTAYAAAWKKGEQWPTSPVNVPISYVTRAAALYRGGGNYVYDPNVLTTPLWWVSQTVRVPSGGTASSQLPATCAPDVPFTVAITVTPAAGVKAYAVQDLVPDGWTVCSISDGGEFDDVNGQVKWGPFFEAQPRTLTYIITPPVNAIGAGVFTGIASFDGLDAGVAGQRSVRVQSGLASSTAVAAMPERYTPGVPIQVSIAVTPAAEASAYAVQDLLPAGWVASAVSHGGVFDPISRAVVWGPFWDATPRTLGYAATPPAGASDVAVFAGTAWFDTAEVPITGQRQAQPQAEGAAQFVSVKMLSNGHFQATVIGAAGATYRILVSTDLVTWQQLGTLQIGANGQAVFDQQAAGKHVYFRAVLGP